LSTVLQMVLFSHQSTRIPNFINVPQVAGFRIPDRHGDGSARHYIQGQFTFGLSSVQVRYPIRSTSEADGGVFRKSSILWSIEAGVDVADRRACYGWETKCLIKFLGMTWVENRPGRKHLSRRSGNNWCEALDSKVRLRVWPGKQESFQCMKDSNIHTSYPRM
jgi:hypothetical protein